MKYTKEIKFNMVCPVNDEISFTAETTGGRLTVTIKDCEGEVILFEKEIWWVYEQLATILNAMLEDS